MTTRQKRLTTTATVLTAGLALSLLSGCTDTSGAGASGGSGDPASGQLSLGWSAGWTAPQVAVAGENGLWEDHDLDVTDTSFDSGRDALEALLGGGVQAAVLTEFPLAASALRDQPVTAVANLSSYDSYRIIGSQSSGISDGSDEEKIDSLDGKKIGVTLGTNMNFILDEFLGANDIDAEIVNIGPGDFTTALDKGDIDAGLTFDSFYAPTREALGDDYTDIAVPADLYTGNMLVVVPDELLADNPDRVRSLVDALGDATTHMEDDPDSAQQDLVTAMGGEADPDTVRERWDEYDYRPGIDDGLRDLMVREAEWISTQGDTSDGGGDGGDGADLPAKIDGVLDPDAA